MKKQLNSMLNKCKSLSRQLARSSSISHTSKSSSSSSRNDQPISCWELDHQKDHFHEIVFVGKKRKPYAISSKHLNHPLLNAVIEKDSRLNPKGDVWVRCEIVLFDHLLWMLDDVETEVTSDTLQELAEFYAM